MTFDELVPRLTRRLGRPLPGPAGQLPMSPRPRFGWKAGEIPRDARSSGVLLLLFPVGGAPHLVLTVRDAELPHHAGQVSLPGGAVEPAESIEAAVLREAHEEIAVDPHRVRIVGALSPLHVPASGYVLHPRVGLTDERPAWRPDEREVARVLEVPLAALCGRSVQAVELREHKGHRVEVPFFAVDGEKVWGATAMVLSEFLCVLGSRPDPWGPAG
jgi:8-oxo-dGTP pyrophosphatase MutT (NUDIX family)